MGRLQHIRLYERVISHGRGISWYLADGIREQAVRVDELRFGGERRH